MNIFLIGFMASGKTKSAKHLAKALNYTSLDSDKEIENDLNKTISHLFSNYGESYFRSLETDWLKKLKVKNTVIATGGGMPCFNNNLELMKSKGRVFYLKYSSKVLTSRLIHSNKIRPLIAGLTEKETQQKVAKLLELREQYYESADYVLRFAESDFSNNVSHAIIKICEQEQWLK